MKRRTGGTLGSAALVVMLTLTGCASTPSSTGASANPGITTPVATPAATPVSDINASVQMFVKALDDLGMKHTDPVRIEVDSSVAEAKFQMTLDGDGPAFIYVLKDAQMMANEVSVLEDGYRLFVTSGNALLFLNSTDLEAYSAVVAPKIAAKVGGVAHCPVDHPCQP